MNGPPTAVLDKLGGGKQRGKRASCSFRRLHPFGSENRSVRYVAYKTRFVLSFVSLSPCSDSLSISKVLKIRVGESHRLTMHVSEKRDVEMGG